MAATTDERIVDESYKAVFVLGKAQIASHVCYDVEDTKDDKVSVGRKAMKNMRIRSEDDKIVTESTNGKILIQVKESANQHEIEQFPFDVNPSESPKVVLSEAQYVPGDVLDELAKSFPKRKNFNQATWQRCGVFSFTDKDLEVGRSDKQGRATVDTWELPQSTGAFPPVETIWPTTDPVATVRFDLPVLMQALKAMQTAGAECVELSLWEKKRPVKVASITQYGKVTDREINALVMPLSEQG